MQWDKQPHKAHQEATGNKLTDTYKYVPLFNESNETRAMLLETFTICLKDPQEFKT
jgi:hypothetical protein